jgi:hypothetical protein
MTMRRAALPLLLFLVAPSIAALGCAGQVPPALVAPQEYGLYKRTRAAATLEERLAAAQRYMTEYPEGRYAEHVGAFFLHTEPLYFAKVKGSADGLEAYLKALPQGPHAREAATRLRDLRAAEKADKGGLAGTAEAAEASVAHEAERRKGVRDRIEQWLGLFLDPQVFGRPMVEAPAPLVVPWALGLPWPLCERTDGPEAPANGPKGAARRCTKLLQLDYRAMDDGEAQERQALVEIAVWEDEPGRPLEVAIGGPELFLRLDETVTARGAAGNDPEAKLRGAERAVEMAQRVFGARVSPQASCKKASDSDVLRLECGGLTLRVLAGALDGEDDRFVVRPTR